MNLERFSLRKYSKNIKFAESSVEPQNQEDFQGIISDNQESISVEKRAIFPLKTTNLIQIRNSKKWPKISRKTKSIKSDAFLILNSELLINQINNKSLRTVTTQMDAQIFSQKQGDLSIDQTKELKPAQDQQYSIQMFLDLNVFGNKQEKCQKNTADNFDQEVKQTKVCSSDSLVYETPSASRKKSIFHNFQKHLITLLKKMVCIRQSTIVNYNQPELIASLWCAFLKCRTFSKKIMHTVFGCVSDTSSFEGLKSISEQVKQIKYILNKYSLEEISSAQRSIREIVVEQTKVLTRVFIQSNTNISRFDEFYQYFLSFLRQIQDGSMSKRMSKSRKADFVKKLGEKPSKQ